MTGRRGGARHSLAEDKPPLPYTTYTPAPPSMHDDPPRMFGPHFHHDAIGLFAPGQNGLLWMAERRLGPVRIVQYCSLRRCISARSWRSGLFWFWYALPSPRDGVRRAIEEHVRRKADLWPNGRKPVSSL